MNTGTARGRNLDAGRRWSALPDNDPPLEWCMDPEGPFFQGPLEMEFLRGKRIFLGLEEQQLAMLAVAEELRAVFLDGGHILEVGTRPGQISPDSSLIFLAVDRAPALRWTFGSPIALPGPVKCHVIGSCSLQVTGPGRFFAAFLKSPRGRDAKTLQDALEKKVRLALTEHLVTSCADSPCDPAALQSILMNLQADTLGEDLAPCGLACTHLALYTAHPPVEHWNQDPATQETAGHLPQLAHN